MARTSQRTSKKRAVFYWRSCVSQRHLEEACEYLADALGVDWPSVEARADVVAVLKGRLRQAERGRLRPREECKPIRRDPELYEIRWTEDVRVVDRDPVSGLFLPERNVHVRLYYAERDGESWFLGLHGHEKRFGGSDGETKAMQDAEIARAANIYRQEARCCWGIPELQQAHPHGLENTSTRT